MEKTQKQLRKSVYRSGIRSANYQIQQAKAERQRALEAARGRCQAAARRIKAKCKAAREKIRKRARDTEAKQKARKEELRESLAIEVGGRGRAGRRAAEIKRMSKAESDSLAEHNIPRELLWVWREDRKRYPYYLEPDMRAEKFLEWASMNEQEIADRSYEKIATEWDDRAIAQAYAAHLAEEEQDEVPF